jgi:hypothetical protein
LKPGEYGIYVGKGEQSATLFDFGNRQVSHGISNVTFGFAPSVTVASIGAAREPATDTRYVVGRSSADTSSCHRRRSLRVDDAGRRRRIPWEQRERLIADRSTGNGLACTAQDAHAQRRTCACAKQTRRHLRESRGGSTPASTVGAKRSEIAETVDRYRRRAAVMRKAPDASV